MKLTDKRFWIWIVIIALMPIMMGVFTGFVLVDSFAELFNYPNIELFLLWEIAYFAGGFLIYSKLHNFNLLKCPFLCWGIVCPLLLCSSFIWAGIRIHDGFTGLAFFMISCVSWGFSIFPLMVGIWLYKYKIDKI